MKKNIKNFLNEDEPIKDWLPDEFKQDTERKARERMREKNLTGGEFGGLMSDISIEEEGKKDRLLDLALKSILKIYPGLKDLIDSGYITIDASISGGYGGRGQKILSKSQIENIRQNDPDFDTKVKKRELSQALSQGKSWDTGFNYVYEIKSELDAIDPDLFQHYAKFSDLASAFYWNNTESLESMASKGHGRIAYADVLPNKERPGSWILKAAAGNFPLLMHELVKSVELFLKSRGLRYGEETNQAVISVADLHKDEIANMNYGRELISRLREILADIEEYEIYMESQITHLMMKMPDNEFLNLMDDIINNNSDQAKRKLRTLVLQLL